MPEGVRKQIATAVVEYLAEPQFAKAPKIAARLRKRGVSEASVEAVEEALAALIASLVITKTVGGLYCLVNDYRAAIELEKMQRDAIERRRPSREASSQSSSCHTVGDPKSRPVLRRTELSGPVTAGTPGVCDKCGSASDSRDKVDHTTWGVVMLCPRCVSELCARSRLRPAAPLIRVVSAPIGSGKNR